MRNRQGKTLAIGLSVALIFAHGAAAQTRSSSNLLRSVNKSPVVKEGAVEPAAIDALKTMSAYLTSASTLAVTSEGTLDVVTGDGQRIQLDGTTQYKIRRPGFVIDYVSDPKSRRFIYDGQNFTIYSPRLGYYSTVAAPPTNREALDTIYKKFGIALPLEDLFRWGDGTSADRLQTIKSAYSIGTATIDGVATNHYAFREPDVDWEVWIQQGEQPLPRKLVIVDRTNASRPTFIAHLNWQVNPTFAASDFAFVPDENAKPIQLATFNGMEK
jgi:hypothetical protein